MPIKPITGIPVTVPISQRGILPVVSVISPLLFYQVVMLKTKTVMDNYKDGILPNGIREFLLFLFLN